jgi:hypothetical protein
MLYYKKYKKYKSKYLLLKMKQIGGTNKQINSARSINKYSGTFEKDDYMKKIKICHNIIKGIQINNIDKEENILDIGSGRFSDIKFWLNKNIKLFIGIEGNRLLFA